MEKCRKNADKNADKYVCIKCNFKCSKNSNFLKHQMTPKHNMIMNGNTVIKRKMPHTCNCGKEYKYASGLSRHKSHCVVDTNDVIYVEEKRDISIDVGQTNDKESIILALITQNKELMNLLASQQQEHKEETKELLNTIQEIVPKIGSNNNNNTTTNNNKFNLQVFLNEDCKDAINFSDFIEGIQVSVEDLENQAVLGYVGGISKLFLDNMKELGVNKRPLHCTDKKRNTLYIKENNAWDKEGSREQLLYGIKVVTGRANQTLCDLKEDNPIAYSDIDSPFSNKCEDIQRSLLPVFPREATFGKVIDTISCGSVVEKEP